MIDQIMECCCIISIINPMIYWLEWDGQTVIVCNQKYTYQLNQKVNITTYDVIVWGLNMRHLFLKHMYPIYVNEYCATIAKNEIEYCSWGFSSNSTITNDHAKILQLSYGWNIPYFYITWNVNLGDELRWLNEGEWQPLLFWSCFGPVASFLPGIPWMSSGF